jgi:hypothetical protein
LMRRRRSGARAGFSRGRAKKNTARRFVPRARNERATRPHARLLDELLLEVGREPGQRARETLEPGIAEISPRYVAGLPIQPTLRISGCPHERASDATRPLNPNRLFATGNR